MRHRLKRAKKKVNMVVRIKVSTSRRLSNSTVRSACLTKLQRRIIMDAVRNPMKMRVKTQLVGFAGSGNKLSI